MITSQTNAQNTKHFCFVLVPGFSLVAFSCAIDALRSANQIVDYAPYSWEAVTPENSIVVSSSGFLFPATPLVQHASADIIAVCGGDRSHEYENPELTRWLHAKATEGVTIGSISDGAFVVAQTGLFSNVPSTIHWKCQDAYRERYRDLDIRTSILELQDKRFSCAGGTSSLDLMLNFIRNDHGPEVAGRIADNYFHDIIRDGSRVQHMTNAFRIAGRSKELSDALLLMEDNLETPITIQQIAHRLKISQRQLDRLFKRYLSITPQAHYRDLRLTRAAGLLIQTGISVTEIALVCGFHSASHLGKFFKQKFGTTPREFRNQQKHA